LVSIRLEMQWTWFCVRLVFGGVDVEALLQHFQRDLAALDILQEPSHSFLLCLMVAIVGLSTCGRRGEGARGVCDLYA